MSVVSLLMDKVLIYIYLWSVFSSTFFVRRDEVEVKCKRNFIFVIFKPTLQVTGSYKGVRLASGQDLYSHQLILDPSFTIPSPLSLSLGDFPSERLQMLSQRDIKGMVARGICITRSSIKPDVSSCSVVYPPRCKRFKHCIGN